LIFVQNRSRRRRLRNFEKFHCVGGAAAARKFSKFSLSRRRRLCFFPKKSAAVAAQPIGLHL
jgi:hypothetical protein